MKIAYFDCFAGISGDMTLGALIDAGADFESLQRELGRLGVQDYDLNLDKVVRHGIAATDIEVRLTGHHHARSFADIKQIIEQSDLAESVKIRSVAMFRRLGEAEAKVHGSDIDQVHFHEVGAVDAIVDIVGACICLEILGIEKIYSSPMPMFHGKVEIAHGVFPLPAPATLELLKNVPWRAMEIEGELVTPTGAAIISELASDFGPMPPMTAHSVGYGAGKMDFGIPNVLRVVVGDSVDSGRGHEEVAVLETNIDDLSPQVYEVVMERLFAAGALDVYLTPIQMKKNRPATLLSVMCAPDDASRMSDIIFDETSTIGIRIDIQRRMCLPREIMRVETRFGPISVKVARRGSDIVNIQPEYEDCKAAAAKHAVPVKMVKDAAVVAFYQRA